MKFYQALLEVIDMRSFSNLWYWIALAVLWSQASRWLMGVPYEMLQRARREGGQTAQDVETLVRICARRRLAFARGTAVPLFFVLGFMVSMTLILAFWYRVEFAQAIFFLLGPMIVVGWVSLRTALKIERGDNAGEALYRRLLRQRRLVQATGLLAIFITAFFGMWRNFSLSILH